MADYNITSFDYFTNKFGTTVSGLPAPRDTGAAGALNTSTIDSAGSGLWQGLTSAWGLGDGTDGGTVNENIRDIPKLVREAP